MNNPYSNIKSKYKFLSVKSHGDLRTTQNSPEPSIFDTYPKIDIYDLNLVNSRAHNASALIGPGHYNLPEIPTGRKITFGPKFVKKQYYAEYSKDFRGGDSPSVSVYTPNPRTIQNKSPDYSIARQSRQLSAKKPLKVQTKVPSLNRKFIHEGPYFAKSQQNYEMRERELKGLSTQKKLGPLLGSRGKRVIDITKWKAENVILIKKGLGL